jgi:hypothetical protein
MNKLILWAGFAFVGLSLLVVNTWQGWDIGAKSAAQREIAERLRSPSTASFVDVSVERLTERNPNSEYIFVHGYPGWTVRGSVDSQNAFGATVRNNFRAYMYYTGNRYHVASVTIE